MRPQVVAGLVALVLLGCESKKAAPEQQQPIVAEKAREPLVVREPTLLDDGLHNVRRALRRAQLL